MNASLSLRAALLVAGLGLSATAQSHKHMLFRVHGPNGATIFLLGSVHLLSAEAGRLPSVVDSAFDRSKTVAFETSFDSIQAHAMELMTHARYANGATLRSSMSPAGVARLDTVLKSYGLSVEQVNGFKPWFVSMLLMQTVMQRANYQAQFGVDMQLNARAHTANKSIVGLESVQAQIGMFDALSAADQERMVLQSNGPDSATRVLAKIKDAWMTGDVPAMDELLNQGLKDVPTLFDKLVIERNEAWIPKIEEMVKGRDDALIVVGAGHLVGKHGLVELLRGKGYAVDQL
jgi:uncharacterized protein YbaP (TraB family)